VITFNHSLERFPRPVQAPRDAKSRLAAEGAILVRVPLAGTIADRHYGGNWVSLDPPRHLNVPSRQCMQLAAATSGLEITRVFFDSLPQQIWASEKYRQDIPLLDKRGRPTRLEVIERGATPHARTEPPRRWRQRRIPSACEVERP
jgi:hypothetical protein